MFSKIRAHILMDIYREGGGGHPGDGRKPEEGVEERERGEERSRD